MVRPFLVADRQIADFWSADDFDDFQSATPTVQSATTLPQTSPPSKANVFDFLGGAAPVAAVQTRAAITTKAAIHAKPVAHAGPAPHAGPAFHAKVPSISGSAFTMGASVPTMQPQQTQSAFANFGQPQQPAMNMGLGQNPLSPMGASKPNYFGGAVPALSPSPANQSKPTTPYATKPGGTSMSGSGAFDDLWSMGLGKPAAPKTGASGPAKSIKDLEREKQQAAIWGTSTQQSRTASMGNGAAFGNFGGSSTAAPSSGGDDLLL